MYSIDPQQLHFADKESYRSARHNVALWQPIIDVILKQHGFPIQKVQAGFNSTNPVFITDSVVIKLFGYRHNWQQAHRDEQASYDFLSQDTSLLTPKRLAVGQLFENADMPWPYIISEKAPGHSWQSHPPSEKEQFKIMATLGEQIQAIHALPLTVDLPTDQDWQQLDLQQAAKQSVLPPHLIEEIPAYCSAIDTEKRVYAHGDLVPMHLFIDQQQLSAIIDWGDAAITNPHYEIAKLYSVFETNKKLLKTFLQASQWPIEKDFPQQCLNMAFYRQAMGLTQHSSFDVFYQLPNHHSLNEIANLEQLAHLMFADHL